MALPPLESLLDLLPDNTTGQIQPVDLRNITETLYNGILDQTTSLQNYLQLSGGEMTGYLTLFNDPQLPKHAVTKRYVDSIAQSQGYLLSDGSIPMDTGYTPASPFDIATKQYVENNGLPLGGTADQILTKQSATDQDAAWQDAPASGQEWSIGTDGQTIEAGQAKYVTSAGDEIFIPDTDKLISLIVTDGSGQASIANPIKIMCNGTPNTFDDGSTLFELDLAGASVEFALLNNVWRLVNFGRILPQNALPFDPQQDLTVTANWDFTEPLTAKIMQAQGGNATEGGIGLLSSTGEIEHHIGSNTGAGNFVYSHGMVNNDLGLVATEDGVPVQMTFSNDTTSVASTIFKLDASDALVSKGDAVTRKTLMQVAANAKLFDLTSSGLSIGGTQHRFGTGFINQSNAPNTNFSGNMGADNSLEYGGFQFYIKADSSGVVLSGRLELASFNVAGNDDAGMYITIKKSAIQSALDQAGISGWGTGAWGLAMVDGFTTNSFTTDTTANVARVLVNSNDTISINLPQLDFRNTTNSFVNIQSARVNFICMGLSATWV